MSSQFGLAGLRQLLELLAASGRTPSAFVDDPANGHAPLYLRHDVDLCPQAALQVGKIEAEYGLRSTFFFLSTSTLYNPGEPPVRAAVDELQRLGHDVGLHADLDGVESDDLAAVVQNQRRVLELSWGIDVSCASVHRPGSAVLGCPRDALGITHTYERYFLEDCTYVADSKRTWRFDDAFRDAVADLSRPLHVNLHPIWWVYSVNDSAVDSLDAFMGVRTARLRDYLRSNFQPYAAQFDGP